MTILYMFCAVIGGTLLLCQFGLGLLGLGGDQDAATEGEVGGDVALDTDLDADFDADLDVADEAGSGSAGSSAGFLGALTLRTVTAALAFFGLAGLAAHAAHWNELQTALVATAFGGLAFWAVHQLMQAIAHLRADGTVRLREAVGQPGTVYLRIPEAPRGLGKVHVVLRQQTVELSAQSANGEIPTGHAVQVVRVLGPDLVEVCPQ